jgi:hypothetical protein
MSTLRITEKFLLNAENVAFFKILDRKVGIVFVGSQNLMNVTNIINSEGVDDFDLVLENVEANNFLSFWGKKI